MREVSPVPTLQGEPRQDGNHPAKPLPVSEISVLPEVVVADPTPPEVPPVLAEPVECVPEDLDYGDSVEAGHVFEDFSNEAIFIQLDDMSSPPSPESTDSSPERDFPANPTVPPVSLPQDTTLPTSQREVLLVHSEDISKPAPQALTSSDQCLLRQDTVETIATTLGAPGVVPMGKDSPLLSGRGCETVRPKDAVAQAPLLRSRNLVKRVTWNLQEAENSTPALDRVPSELALPVAELLVVVVRGVEQAGRQPPQEPLLTLWAPKCVQPLRDRSAAWPWFPLLVL